MPAASGDVFLPGRTTAGRGKLNRWYIVGAIGGGLVLYLLYRRFKSSDSGAAAASDQTPFDTGTTGGGGSAGGGSDTGSLAGTNPIALPSSFFSSPFGTDPNALAPTPYYQPYPDYSQLLPDLSGQLTAQIPDYTAALQALSDQLAALQAQQPIPIDVAPPPGPLSHPLIPAPKKSTAPAVKLVSVPVKPGLPTITQKYPAPIAKALTSPISRPPSATGAGSKTPTPKPTVMTLGTAKSGVKTTIVHGRGLGGPQA